TGTVTMDITKAVNEVKAGKIDFKVDKFGIIHAGVARLSFEPSKIVDNFNELYGAIIKLKPTTVKGAYVKSVFISSTMSLGLEIDIKSTDNN
ncbi:MAG: 50S ribosomal protein L1, partial [Rikenellaceae bacterium]